MRVKRKAGDGLAFRPENLIIWRTPACFAVSMKLHWVSASFGSADEIRRSRSTPSSAAPNECGRSMSPSAIAAPGSLSSARLRPVSREHPDGYTLAGELAHHRGPVQTSCSSYENHQDLL